MKSTMSKQQAEKNRILLAMVALNAPAMAPTAALVDSLKAIPAIALDMASVESKNGNLAFDLGKNHAAIALMPAPIPWPDLEGPCATAWWWPEATEKMRNHNSHIIVALAGDTGNLVERNITLTHLTAAVASHTDAVGIYWCNGTLVHDPQAFIEQAQEISPDDLPLPFWIDFRVERNDDGSYRLFTTGMKAFNKLEIEIPHSQKEPTDVLNFACCIAEYIITKNPTIRDGHTIGRSATEKIPVTHAPSMWNSKLRVLRLEF